MCDIRGKITSGVVVMGDGGLAGKGRVTRCTKV